MIRRTVACRHHAAVTMGITRKTRSANLLAETLRVVVVHIGECLAGARTGIYNLELVATPMESDSPALRIKVSISCDLQSTTIEQGKQKTR